MSPPDEPRVNLIVVQVIVAAIGIGVPIFWSYAVAQSGRDGGSAIGVFYLSVLAAIGVAIVAARRRGGWPERIKSFVAHVCVYFAALLLVGGGLFMLMVR